MRHLKFYLLTLLVATLSILFFTTCTEEPYLSVEFSSLTFGADETQEKIIKIETDEIGRAHV